jgi:hypothetical protein
VGVHDIGSPVAELGGELHDLVVGRRHLGYEIVVGEPRQIGAGAQHTHTVDHAVVGGVGVVQAEDRHVVAGADHGPGQPVDVSGDPSDDQRRVLPGQHQNAHGAEGSRARRLHVCDR